MALGFQVPEASRCCFRRCPVMLEESTDVFGVPHILSCFFKPCIEETNKENFVCSDDRGAIVEHFRSVLVQYQLLELLRIPLNITWQTQQCVPHKLPGLPVLPRLLCLLSVLRLLQLLGLLWLLGSLSALRLLELLGGLLWLLRLLRKPDRNRSWWRIALASNDAPALLVPAMEPCTLACAS